MPDPSDPLETIFDAALEAPSPAERAAYLDRACGDDAALRRRVEELLRAHDRAGGFLEPPAAGEAAPPEPAPARPGDRVGPYKLLQQIGEGGMGLVFMAEQQEPVRRRVALKVIKPGMDSRQVLARFEAERQALALMDHPNIARVLDAGSTETGRPFFVMELVHGVPITAYCDANGLTPRERLALFVPACRAIQHAHQKGVIHRDVKPSNILVTVIDGRPVPKVIDFGVAKAIEQRLTERTMFTQFGAVVGTLEYMSPEQAELSGHDVDTRSDIYSLGVILYELLTGTTPLERASLRQAAFDEVLRRIREEDPPSPSTRLSTTERLASIAAQRRTEPERLARLVRGDLDWIAMKALEKDRTRRYETADALARDIERHLADEPVEAGPPSAGYRVRKFARKHRAALATASAFAAVLVAATILSAWQADRATRARKAEADQRLSAQAEAGRALEAEGRAKASLAQAERSEAEAKAVLEFFQNKVLAAARPRGKEGGLGPEATVRAALDAAEPGVAAGFAGRPAVEAAIRHTLGLTYLYLGDYPAAIRQLERARELRKGALGPEHVDTLETLGSLAGAYYEAGRTDEATTLQEDVLRLSRATLGPEHPDTLTALNNLATYYLNAGRAADAVPRLDEALRLNRAKLGPADPSTLIILGNLAGAYGMAGRVDEAIAIRQEALRLKKEALGVDQVDTLTEMGNLASLYRMAGRLDESIKLQEETMRRRRSALGPEHPLTLIATHNLSGAYRAAGRAAEAIPLAEEAVRLAPSKLGPDHPTTHKMLSNRVACYLDARRWADAEAAARPWLERLGGRPPDDATRSDAMLQLGAALAGLNRHAEAEPMLLGGYEALTARANRDPGSNPKDRADAAARIASFYEAWGRPDKAVEWRSKAGSAAASGPVAKQATPR